MSLRNWFKPMGAIAALSVFILASPADRGLAQTANDQAAAPQAAAANQPKVLSEEELETLVARVALYPDDLVALVLAGSLYPLQIVQAQRYLDDVKTKKDLKPDASWDGSVISLLNYPQIIKMMNDDLTWTQSMGDAVVNQQKDVLVAIQQLRDKAVAQGVIKSDDKVIVEKEKDNIVIKPAKQEVTYVPQYDPVILTSPTYVEAAPIYYGDPYPSYYYPYAPYWAGFVTGAIWGAAIDWDNWHSWGGDVDIDIDNNFNRNDFNFDRNNINNINWDNNKFNFNRDSIVNNLKGNNFDRLDRKTNLDRSKLSNLAGRGNTISGRDVRRDVQQGLKDRGQGGGNIADRGSNRPNQGAGNRPNKGGAGVNNKLPGKGANANRPAKKKNAGANRPSNRPANRPAARADNRPRQMNGFGDYGGGRQVRSYSQRGNISRGGGGRGGGGGARVRRR